MDVQLRKSINDVTIPQLVLACEQVDEMIAAGITENLGIRILEHLADLYAKRRNGGSASPYKASHVKVWSKNAAALYAANPCRPFKDCFCVEHGTPRRAFARMVRGLHTSRELTADRMNKLVDERWKIAVLTHDEHAQLNKVARSRSLNTPEERWALINLEFVDLPTELSCTCAALAHGADRV